MTRPTPPAPESAHTPTPWWALHSNAPDKAASYVHDGLGRVIATMPMPSDTDTRGGSPCVHGTIDANLQTIVEAVNSHASLRARVAELEAAARKFTEWESGWRMEESDYLESHPSNAGLADHLLRFGVPREEQLMEALTFTRTALHKMVHGEVQS